MEPMTIEQLARRVTELEERLRAVEVAAPKVKRGALTEAVRDVRGVDSDFMDLWAEECRKLREADREATRLEFERMDEAARRGEHS